jgi:hypothetical protein
MLGGNVEEERISIDLVASDTDPPLRSNEYQIGLSQVFRELQAVDSRVSFRMFMQEAVDAPSFLMGGFTIAKSVGLQAVPVIVAWLHGRYGRKVRLKVGDVEAEARNVSEIEALLKCAEKLRPRIQE